MKGLMPLWGFKKDIPKNPKYCLTVSIRLPLYFDYRSWFAAQHINNCSIL